MLTSHFPGYGISYMRLHAFACGQAVDILSLHAFAGKQGSAAMARKVKEGQVTVRLGRLLHEELIALAGVLYPEGTVSDLVRGMIDSALPEYRRRAAEAALDSGGRVKV